MKKAEYIPTNFQLSQRAIAKINELTKVSSDAMGRLMVPALFWHEEYEEATRETVVFGPGFGWYFLDEVPTNLLQHVDGTALIFAVTSKTAVHFKDKVLDYQDGKSFFLAS
ncbi:hypothetical protein ABIB83_005278 [Bradyrhizobium sp. I1.8.5]|jgi:hypothetical protein|uniref:hypothetical protein n=1 Tax=unclassified Bradyrhizobium TaxID=2631580 RepID=UPI0033975EB8